LLLAPIYAIINK